MRLQVDKENWLESALAGLFLAGFIALCIFFATGGDAVLVDLHLEPERPTIGAHHD